MKVCDIAALAEVAHRRGALLVVDNTFMSPFFQRPLALGADIVVHSTTKFLNGHSDSVGGVAVVKDPAPRRVAAVLPERGGRHPLPLRLLAGAARHQDPRPAHAAPRGERAAWWPSSCASRRRCAKVYWPGFPDHPGHEVHKRQATRLRRADLLRPRQPRGGRAASWRRVRLCSLGESLGGIETLISHPATMTHAGYTPDGARRARHRRRPGADQRGLRGRGGPDRRPAERVRGRLTDRFSRTQAR